MPSVTEVENPEFEAVGISTTSQQPHDNSKNANEACRKGATKPFYWMINEVQFIFDLFCMHFQLFDTIFFSSEILRPFQLNFIHFELNLNEFTADNLVSFYIKDLLEFDWTWNYDNFVSFYIKSLVEFQQICL